MNEQPETLQLFRKKDILIYLILISFFLLIVFLVAGVRSASKIFVTIEGKHYYQFSIEDAGRHKIEKDGKHLMDLIIEDSNAYIKHSECPLHLCERGRLNDAGVLVCVPQKVLITFEDEQVVQKDNEVDLVTR